MDVHKCLKGFRPLTVSGLRQFKTTQEAFTIAPRRPKRVPRWPKRTSRRTRDLEESVTCYSAHAWRHEASLVTASRASLEQSPPKMLRWHDGETCRRQMDIIDKHSAPTACATICHIERNDSAKVWM